MRIIDAAIGASWAMEEPALATLLEIAAREHEVTPQALEAMRSETLEKAERAKIRDGVAIVYAEGAMFKRANLMTEFCGATSYESLMRDFKVAVDNQNVRAILLAIDTPGGEAAGVGELASAVRAARGTKPIVAYAGDLAASAGYWLASAADRIVIGSGAAVGSIGVRASYSDTSERDARSGVRRHEFVSSQSPYKISDPKTTDGKARIKARVDALAQVFVDAVADNRGVSVAHVLEAFGKGDVLIGEAAVKAGMADAIGTFESTLASLASQTDPLSAIGLSTSSEKRRAIVSVEDSAAALILASCDRPYRADRQSTSSINASTRHLLPDVVKQLTAHLSHRSGVVSTDETAVALMLNAVGITPPTPSAPQTNPDDAAVALLIEASRHLPQK